MVAVDPPRLHGLDCQVEATDLPIESLGRGLSGIDLLVDLRTSTLARVAVVG